MDPLEEIRMGARFMDQHINCYANQSFDNILSLYMEAVKLFTYHYHGCFIIIWAYFVSCY
ncbi:hypothetical protein Fmac_015976 [Flemingia macrophylla]|uniref:Uncharacterized protein n=1 Tax=Flemingia macrophylla TaxID=520843 RepID=A0ABD1MG30_9FABA